tara:strand:- start:279 stop:404 length:126 start_codon:yes stop_codon:yes gene_type:complete
MNKLKVLILTGGRQSSKDSWHPVPEEAKTDKKEYLKGVIKN